ncbi:conserved hypothetical protein [Pediculus humanus corporis]|uniref:Sugar transporter n=1 Tax=Pediculus humanus subsp. corporis TaxID=121224 RepID=E0VGF6_PEDHC|nr:uncharacterized protein Phum_PHUM181220 [Pediculus humanus corporis]EEB12462.1 conserved hypothetical protein [Pediculus humanus corporis]
MFGNGVKSGELNFSQRVAYGLGHFMNDVCSGMWFTYTLLFYELVLKMPSSIAGLLVCVGQVADAIASPICGILIDRYGTRKSWHLIGTAFITYSFVLIYSDCPWFPNTVMVVGNSTTDDDLPSWQNYNQIDIITGTIYFCFLVSIFQWGWATVQIAHLAIITDLAKDKNERANLTALRYSAGVLAYMLVYLITWFILHVTKNDKGSIGPNDAYKFRSIALLGLTIGGIFTVLFHVILKTPSDSGGGSDNKTKKGPTSWSQIAKDYFKSILLYQVILIYFTSRMLVNITMVYLPLYVVEKIGDEVEYIATVPLICYLASFFSSLIVRQCRKFISSKMFYIIGMILSFCGCIWILRDFTHTAEIFGIAALLGAAGSVSGVASLCLCADMIGTDTVNGAFVYSIVTAGDKFLGGLAILFIEHSKTALFSDPNLYYQNVMVYGCGIPSILGLIALLTMYIDVYKSKIVIKQNGESSSS